MSLATRIASHLSIAVLVATTLSVLPTANSAPSAQAAPNDSECELPGYGLEAYPYFVDSLEDFREIPDCDNTGVYFLQTQDVNFAGFGPQISGLYGHFDGGGKSIVNLVISEQGTDRVGFFGIVNDGSSIRNVTIQDASFSGRDFVGALAGELQPGAIVDNIFLRDVLVNGTGGAGALAGRLVTSVSNVIVENSTVVSSGNVGGLAGSLHIPGGSEGSPNTIRVENISIANTRVEHITGNPSTGLGGLFGVFGASEHAALELEQIGLQVTLEDGSAQTMSGALFGFQGFSGGGTFHLTANEMVLDVEHEVAAPVQDRPLAMLSGSFTQVSADVSRVVANLQSHSSGTDQPIDLLGREFLFTFTSVAGSEVYFNTDLHPAGNFRYTAGADPKTAAELTAPTLYDDWSRTQDFNEAYFDTDDYRWYQFPTAYPWPSFAAARGHGFGQFFRLAHPENIANGGQLGDFTLQPEMTGLNFFLRVEAVESGTSNVVELDLAAHITQTTYTVTSTDVLMLGGIHQINADLKKIMLAPGTTASRVDVTFSISPSTDLSSVHFQKTITLDVLGCGLSGAGTEAAPYLVQQESDLRLIMACDGQGVHFELTQDLYLTRPHVPIGNDVTKFKGVFDGAGFSINDLVLDTLLASSQGLFGVTGDGNGERTRTEIKNLTVRGEASGERRISLLVGDVDALKVSNVQLFGEVSGYSDVGLLAGDAENLRVTDVLAMGRAIATFDEVGLLVGDGNHGEIWLEDIEIEGQVVGNEQVGGLVGFLGGANEGGLVRRVVARVDVIGVYYTLSSDQEEIGGLVGRSQRMRYLEINLTGLVIGTERGRVSAHADPVDPETHKERIGGLIGESYGDTIRGVEVQIDVESQNPSAFDLNVGGLIGEAGRLELSSANYQGAIRGYRNVGGVLGVLNHDEDRIHGSSLISDVVANAYVFAVDGDVGGFAGQVNHGRTATDSTQIQDVRIFGEVTATDDAEAGGFIGDIDVGENVGGLSDWAGTITILRSTAAVDVASAGDGHAGGFIGYIEPVSPILIADSSALGEVSIEGSIVTGTGAAGGFTARILAGMDGDATVTILRSFASGDVTSTGSDAGGFFGSARTNMNFPDALLVDQSFASGSVEGNSWVGGFVGYQEGGLITNSYSTGSVLGNERVGGYAGELWSVTLANSFTASSPALRDPTDSSSKIGRFVGEIDQSTLTAIRWNSDKISLGGYHQAYEGTEVAIDSGNLGDLTSYAGWSITDTLEGTPAMWVICPEESSVGPILWFQVETLQTECGETFKPLPPTTLNTGGTPLDFNFFTSIGTFADVGFEMLYSDVIAGSDYQVDARVTLLDASQVDPYDCSSAIALDPPKDLLRRLDNFSSNPERNRWIRLHIEDVCLQGQEEGFVEFKVEFLIESMPVVLEQVKLDITDVDDRQFVEVAGFDRYSLSEDTILSARVVNGVTRIEETQDLQTSIDGLGDFDFIGSAFTLGRVQFEFDSASEITIKVGAVKNGAAYFDFDFSAGGPWADARGPVDVSTLINPVLELASTPAASYVGPVITSVAPLTFGRLGGEVTLTGQNLDTVSRIQVDGQDLVLRSVAANRISATVPAGLSAGLKSLDFTSDFGRLTVADLIRISADGAGAVRGWTVAQPGALTAKVYARGLVGAGKVTFVVNGREVAWVRASDTSDPKLRVPTSGPMAGVSYLVRTVPLVAGKNVIEIYVEGERVRRVAYTR